MDENEIKRVLRAARPNGQDAADADVARAEQAADPALRARLEEERAFDRAFAAKLQEASVPEGLKERLLAVAPVEGEIAEQAPAARGVRRRASQRLIGLLAIVVAICVAVVLLQPRLAGGMELAEFRQEALATFGPGFAMQHHTPDVEQVREWLASHGGDDHFAMPPGLKGMPPLGCSKVNIDGHEATLVCFGLKDGRIAHLFAMPKSAMKNPPESPVTEMANGWMTSAWSDGGMMYLLAVNDTDVDALRHVFPGKFPEV